MGVECHVTIYGGTKDGTGVKNAKLRAIILKLPGLW